MRKAQRRVVITLAASALLLLPFNAGAQESRKLQKLRDEPDTPQFEKDISVRLQLIDVTAVDSRGDYVTNLTVDDFTLLVNGKEMPIRTFDAYFPGVLRAEADSPGIPASAMPERLIVLFFDQAYSSFRGLREAKKAATEFVKRNLSPGDQIMVVGYDRSLNVYQEFTRDREKLVDAVQGVNYGFSTLTGDRLSYFRGENQFNVRIYMQALQKLALYLKMFRGRKTLIMLSEGFDQRIALAYLPQYLRETEESFNDANTSIFSLDVRGLDSGSISIRRRQARQDTLSTFAIETGGVFYRGSNDIESLLLDIDSDISYYYVLGFYIGEERDGAFHDVAVRTTVPGVKLRCRKGFFAPKPFGKLSKDERLVQLEEGFHRNSPFSELDASIGVHVYPRADGSAVATVIVDVPLGSDPKPTFELLGYVHNKEGKLLDAFHKRFELPSRRDGATFRHMETVNLDPGENLIRIVIRNNATGERAYQFISARMPVLRPGLHASTIAFQARADGFVLSSATAVRSMKRKFDVPQQEPADPLSSLSRVGILVSPSAEVDRSGEVGVIVRVVGVTAADTGPRLATSYTLRAADGRSYNLSERDLKVYPIAGSNAAIVYSVLDLKNVPAGDYILRARIDDTIAELVVGQQVEITVR